MVRVRRKSMPNAREKILAKKTNLFVLFVARYTAQVKSEKAEQNLFYLEIIKGLSSSLAVV